MKVFVSEDMEGILEVTHSEYIRRDGKEHEHARRLMTGEVNACF